MWGKGKKDRRRVRDPTEGTMYARLPEGGIPKLTYPLRMSSAGAEMEGSEVIYAAVTRISNALALIPCNLYKGTEVAEDDPRQAIIAIRPNRIMSAYTFKRSMEGYRNTEGRCYAAKQFDESGLLCGLTVLNPTSVTPMIEEGSGELWYVVRRRDGAIEYLHSWYVLALHHMTLDGISSIRVADVLADTVDYNADIKTFSLESAKGVSRGLIMEFPGNMDEPRRRRSVSEFLELYRQSGGQVIALESGVRATKLDGSPVDTKVFDVERITRSRVATVYNLPPHLLGDYTDATASSMEQQNIEFLTLTMLPIVKMWQEELDYKLLTPTERKDGYAFRFDVDAYLSADSAALASRNQSEIRCGISTVNELRAKYHRPRVEGGDDAMISKDVAPVKYVARGATIDADQLAGEKNS